MKAVATSGVTFGEKFLWLSREGVVLTNDSISAGAWGTFSIIKLLRSLIEERLGIMIHKTNDFHWNLYALTVASSGPLNGTSYRERHMPI